MKPTGKNSMTAQSTETQTAIQREKLRNNSSGRRMHFEDVQRKLKPYTLDDWKSVVSTAVQGKRGKESATKVKF